MIKCCKQKSRGGGAKFDEKSQKCNTKYLIKNWGKMKPASNFGKMKSVDGVKLNIVFLETGVGV